ncbi:MAG: sulfite exporter TauE/SafE family protein [Rubrivivax sp.]
MFDSLILDPAFYAVAVPAVLLMGLSKSGFGAGFGALAVPLMALAVPVPQAAAIMLPLLMVMDAFGIAALWRERDRALVRLLLPAGLVGTVLGTLLFGWLSASVVAGLVGLLTLAFLAIRRLFPPRADAPPPSRWMGRLLAMTSGFTSFVAHAGGPPIGFYVLPLKLPPVTFTATMSVFFAAINLSKWGPYAWLGLIDARNMSTSLVLMPLAPLGVWLGVWCVRRIPQRLFYGLFELGMLLTGLKLLWDGLLA